MLTPSYLDRVSDDVVLLYSEFEMSVLEDIARRMDKMGDLTATADFQIKMLEQSNLLYQDIIEKIAELTGMSVDEVTTTIESSSIKSDNFEGAIYRANGMDPRPLPQSAAMLQVIDANIFKTNNNLANLTMTTASNAQELFIRSTTLAQMQVQSGAFTYDQAITNAINQAANDGLKVTYPSGAKRGLEGAVRSNVLTGVNQTASSLVMMRMDEMGQDLLQTSAHAGARLGDGFKGHVNWQGKIFSRSGTSEKYDSFVPSTGYGHVEGLSGANCRHSFYVYVEGQDIVYTEEVMKQIEKPDVEWNGKTISYYEATQVQRRMEVNVRKYKKRSRMLKAANKDAGFADAKIKQWQARLRKLTKETGVQRDYTRERIARVS